MKRSLCILLAVFFVLFTVFPVAADEPDVTVTLNDSGNITSIAFNSVTSSYTIPTTVNGKTVRGIASNCAFTGTVNTLIVPEINLYSNSLSNATANTIILNGSKTELPSKLFAGNRSVVSVLLPDYLTKIPEYCFSNCFLLSSVGFPSSVTEIERAAFSSCVALKSINLSGALRIIGDNAFADSGLQKITTDSKEVFPPVTSIGDSAFYGIEITSLILPDSVTSIGAYAFSGCKSLTDLYIGSGITRIPLFCFNNCTNLYKLSGGKNITQIEQYAFSYSFSNDRYDANISFDSKISYMGPSAFEGCRYLDSIQIFNGNCIIDSSAFTKCATLIKSYTGGSVESFCKSNSNVSFESLTGGSGSNDNYDNLQYSVANNEIKITAYVGSGNKNVVVPATINGKPVTSIGANAFMRSDVESVVLPSSVTYIYDFAFANCTSLKTIVILDSCRSISSTAFSNCLSTLVIKGVQDSYAKMYAGDYKINFSPITDSEYKCLTGQHANTGIETKSATCTEDGYTRTVCKDCGAVISETILPKRTEHEYETTVVAPTCTAEGYTLRKCKYCTVSEKIDIKSATGHEWGEWTVIVKPTYTSVGTKTRHCLHTGCDEVQTEIIPMLVIMSFDEISPTDANYKIVEKVNDGNKIKLFCGFVEKKDVSGFTGLFDDQYNVVIVDSKNNLKTKGYIATGDKFALIDAQGNVVDTLTVVVAGDINGDGKVTAADYIAQRRSILGTLKLSDAQHSAADIDGNGSVKASDYIKLRRYLLGILTALN